MRGRLLKIVGGTVLALAGLLTGAWLAFVPLAKEPPYRFVATWGERGTDLGQFLSLIHI